MNTGAVVGIIIVLLVAIAGVVGFIIWYLKAKKTDVNLMGSSGNDKQSKKRSSGSASGKRGKNNSAILLLTSSSNERLKTSSSTLALNDIWFYFMQIDLYINANYKIWLGCSHS